jgi:hypothetical protein
MITIPWEHTSRPRWYSRNHVCYWTQVRRFNPDRERWIFKGDKNPDEEPV